MANEKYWWQPPADCPENQPLQLLQHNDALFIACNLRNTNLEKCRNHLKSICRKPVRVYANSRNYLACEIKEPLPPLNKNSRRWLKQNPLCNMYCCKEPAAYDGNLWKSPSFALEEPSEEDFLRLLKENFIYEPNRVRRMVVRETNKYRAMHRACPLKMNQDLSAYAQLWAEHLACHNYLETRPFPIFGENIMCLEKTQFCLKRMMKLWYQEKYNYNYLEPGFSLCTGHFTQMVWRNTESLGVGVASNDSRIWIVCNYDPAGNVRDHFQENVIPRKLLYSS